MNEGYAAVADSDPGLGVDQLDALLLQAIEHRVDVVHGVGDVVQALATSLDELADRRLGPKWAKQLDVAFADVEEDSLDTLGLDGLAVRDGHPEGALIKRDRGVEIRYCDADVVDAAEHGAQSMDPAREVRGALAARAHCA
jgi:hypothetical protein